MSEEPYEDRDRTLHFYHSDFTMPLGTTKHRRVKALDFALLLREDIEGFISDDSGGINFESREELVDYLKQMI